MREVMPVIEERIAAGVPAKKIRVVFNKVDVDDAGDLPRLFSLVFGCHDAHKGFTLRPDAVLFSNEVFDRLRPLKMTVAEVIADETDYRAVLREAKDESGKAHAFSMISAQRLARSAQKSLNDVFKALFR